MSILPPCLLGLHHQIPAELLGKWASSLKEKLENPARSTVRVPPARTQPNAMLFWSWPYIINNNNCKILLPTMHRLKQPDKGLRAAQPAAEERCLSK